MTGALALVAALTLSSQLQTHPTGLPSVGPSRANSLRTAPIMDKLYEQAGKPALDFDFARYKDLHDNASGKTSLVNFSRSAAQSPGTYVGSDGLIHDAAVNLALYSEQFDNAAWNFNTTALTVSANAEIAPDGKQTADLLTTAATPGASRLRQNITFSAGSHTYSFYGKTKSGTQWVYYTMYDGTTSFPAWAELTTEWQRFDLTATMASGFGLVSAGAVTGNGSTSYQGGAEIVLWGAQLEETDAATMQPTAYIKTTSQALAAPRFDHVPTTGNLTTNLLTYSEMFDVSAGWTPYRVQFDANSASPPNGEQVADKIREDTTPATTHLLQKTLSLTTNRHTLSLYAKAAERDILQVRWATAPYRYVEFDLTSETVTWRTAQGTATASISDEGNGWKKIVFSDDRTAGTNYLNFHLCNAANSITYDGDGTSGIYLYGAQLEASPTPGPYVRTLSETRSISDANAESLGLLVEEARANLFPYSDQIETLFPSKIGIITQATDAAASPNGKNTADLFKESATTTIHEIYRPSSGAGTYAWSIFVKQGAGNRVLNLCSSNGASNYFAVRFDLQTETIAAPVVSGAQYSGVSGQLKHYGNGWYRATVLFTSSDVWYPQVAFSTSNTSTIGNYGLETYAGDNTSSFYLFGAQLEEASFPTSWIPTGGTSQNRYADVAAVQDEDFSTTNLLAYSESFDVGWNPTGLEPIVANDAVSPDGQTTADKIIPTAASGAHDVHAYPGVTSGTQYALTVYAKPAGFNYISLFNQHSGTGFGTVVFDVQNGTVTAAANGASTSQASISSVGNGWFRAVYMFTATATSSSSYTGINARPDGGSGAFVGDGTSGIYLWGASLTATEYPVEYVTTRNLLTDSQDFERGTWVKTNATIGNDVAQAPDGTLTADSYTPTNTSYWTRVTNDTGSSSSDSTHTAYVKANGYTKVAIREDQTTGAYASFDLSSGSLLNYAGAHRTTPTITSVGNGWYRIRISSTSALHKLGIWVLSPSYTTGTPVVNWTANGTDGILVWGAQLEPGTTATDYVRTVDVVGKAYNWYEPTEGTVFVEGSFQGDYGSATTTAWGISNGTNTYRIQGFFSSGSTPGSLIANPSVYTIYRPAVSRPFDFAHAYSFEDGQHSVAFNGGANTTSAALFGPSGLSIMYIGQRADGANAELLKKHIRRLTYWPRRQADSTLQVITQ